MFICFWQQMVRLWTCGIQVFNGKVLMVRNDLDLYYYSVGEAVRYDKKVQNAAIREFWEETGWKFE